MPAPTPSSFESTAFIARLQSRDEAAFHLLVRHHHRKLLGFAATFVGRELAEEVVQEAWISVWKGLTGFSGNSQLKTWIYTIVRNECLGRLKREARSPLVQMDDERYDDGVDGWLAANFSADGHWNTAHGTWNLETPDSILEVDQMKDCLEAHLASLVPQQRAVFMMRELGGIELQDICNILAISDSNCRVLLHRARLKLLQVINHYQSTGECSTINAGITAGTTSC